MAAALTLDLGGTDWQLSSSKLPAKCRVQLPESIPGVVPGCVHLDLQKAGLIPDVFWRDNERELYWVAEGDWEYRREFEVDANFDTCDKVVLTCDGLDTLATVRINGSQVISADNMFRLWTADIKHLLHFKKGTSPETNSIEVTFRSTLPLIAEKQKERELHAGNATRPEYKGEGWVRKEPASYGWDWGCAAPTFGIWRPIRIQGFKSAWLESIHITHPEISEAGVGIDPDTGCVSYKAPAVIPISVEVELGVACEKALNDTRLEVQIEREVKEGGSVLRTEFDLDDLSIGESGVTGTEEFSSKAASASSSKKTDSTKEPGKTPHQILTHKVELTLEKPDLWWPNGTGLRQTLYRVSVSLVSKATLENLSRQERRVGLRTVKLVREKDEWGESFGFAVNGVKVFAKGANWIPADIYLPRLTPEKYGALLKSTADAGMNMIRAWGGGIYEDPAFYEACDELGILVWQEFIFACSTYPVHDPAWLHNCEHEAIGVVQRLRHHACLALWCGNNELEQGEVGDSWEEGTMPWDQYTHLFDTVLKDVVEKYDGHTDYWPGSPHTPLGGIEGRRNANDPGSGDAHCWDVWHGGNPFEVQRNWRHRFVSEFGFQSFPEPETVAGYTLPEDRNVSSYVMDFHQRSVGRGNRAIFENLLEWFQMPRNFSECLWMSQLTQALCIQYAVEHLRRQQARTEGVLYWQLNDEWPAPTWSSLDHRGRWKALHYFARRFYSRVLVTGLEDADRGTVQVHLSNQELVPVSGEITWRITTAAGTELESGRTPVQEAAPQANTLVTTLDISEALTKHGPRDVLVWLEWRGGRGQSPDLWRHVAEEEASCVSRNLVLFARPKHLKLLKDPKITVTAKRTSSDGPLLITLTSKHPALWVRLETDDTKLPSATGWLSRLRRPGNTDQERGEKREDPVKFDDNFVHLDGCEPITLSCTTKLNAEAVRAALKVTPVNMTWEP